MRHSSGGSTSAFDYDTGFLLGGIAIPRSDGGLHRTLNGVLGGTKGLRVPGRIRAKQSIQ